MHRLARRGERGRRAGTSVAVVGADCVLECVGTEDARPRAVATVRDGGNIGAPSATAAVPATEG